MAWATGASNLPPAHSQPLTAFCSSHGVPLWVLKRFCSWHYPKADDYQAPSSQLSSSVFMVSSGNWAKQASSSLPAFQAPKAQPHNSGLLSTCHVEGLASLAPEFCSGFVRAPLPPEGPSWRMGSPLRFSLTFRKNCKGRHVPQGDQVAFLKSQESLFLPVSSEPVFPRDTCGPGHSCSRL